VAKPSHQTPVDKSRSATLSHLQAHRRNLELQLQDSQQQIVEVDLAIDLLRSRGHAALERLGLPTQSRYASLPAQRAVEQYMRDHPDETLTATQVARGLLAGTFPARSKNFSTQVMVALKRLATKRVVTKTKEDKVTVFRLAEEAAEP